MPSHYRFNPVSRFTTSANSINRFLLPNLAVPIAATTVPTPAEEAAYEAAAAPLRPRPAPQGGQEGYTGPGVYRVVVPGGLRTFVRDYSSAGGSSRSRPVDNISQGSTLQITGDAGSGWLSGIFPPFPPAAGQEVVVFAPGGMGLVRQSDQLGQVPPYSGTNSVQPFGFGGRAYRNLVTPPVIRGIGQLSALRVGPGVIGPTGPGPAAQLSAFAPFGRFRSNVTGPAAYVIPDVNDIGNPVQPPIRVQQQVAVTVQQFAVSPGYFGPGPYRAVEILYIHSSPSVPPPMEELATTAIDAGTGDVFTRPENIVVSDNQRMRERGELLFPNDTVQVVQDVGNGWVEVIRPFREGIPGFIRIGLDERGGFNLVPLFASSNVNPVDRARINANRINRPIGPSIRGYSPGFAGVHGYSVTTGNHELSSPRRVVISRDGRNRDRDWYRYRDYFNRVRYYPVPQYIPVPYSAPLQTYYPIPATIPVPAGGYAGPGRYRVNAPTGLNVRLGPGLQYESRGVLNFGDIVDVAPEVSPINGWVQTLNSVYPGGYVFAAYLTKSAEQAPAVGRW